MENLKGACIIGQSGGPTAVINASAQGVIQTGPGFRPDHPACWGPPTASRACWPTSSMTWARRIPAQLDLLQFTPSSALGSCRYKLADPDVDDTDYQRILRGLQEVQRALLLLQRRQRFHGHLQQDQPVYAAGGLRVPHHRRAQDHRQRPGRHRPLPRLCQRRQVHRHLLHGAVSGRQTCTTPAWSSSWRSWAATPAGWPRAAGLASWARRPARTWSICPKWTLIWTSSWRM